jgi:release factor glutamine methyltransferase
MSYSAKKRNKAPMQYGDWLQKTTKLLTDSGSTTPRLDAIVLLEDQIGTDRAQLLAHPERELSDQNINVLTAQIEARSQHVPLAQIRQKSEFYGREFFITAAVLEPRPESETMIDLVKKLVANDTMEGLANDTPAAVYNLSGIRVADVGTGSGALGITLQLELPNMSVDLLEIDDAAIAVAQQNVVSYTLITSIIKTDLLEGSPKDYDILLCNLPYVPDESEINEAARHEPPRALFGGPDGLTLYRRLFTDIQNLQHRPLYILTESFPAQHAELTKIAASRGYILAETDDFIQVFAAHSLHKSFAQGSAS